MNNEKLEDLVFISDQNNGIFAIASDQEDADAYIQNIKEENPFDESLYDDEDKMQKAKDEEDVFFETFTFEEVVKNDMLTAEKLAGWLLADRV